MNHSLSDQRIHVLAFGDPPSMMLDLLKVTGCEYSVESAGMDPGSESFSRITPEGPDILVFYLGTYDSAGILEAADLKSVLLGQSAILVFENLTMEEEFDLHDRGYCQVVNLRRLPSTLCLHLERISEFQKNILRKKEGELHSAVASGIAIGASRILHDLTSPFTPVQNYFDMKEMGLLESAQDLREAEEMMIEGVEGIASLIDRWHKCLAEREPSMDLQKLETEIKQIAEYLRYQHARISIDVVVEISETDNGANIQTMIECNPLLLRHAFMQLFINSVEAMEGTDDPWIEVKIAPGRSRTTVMIEDNGQGVPLELKDKLWKDFVSTKGSPSAGLGLGITRSLLTLHGASIQLVEKPTRGTKLEIIFRHMA